MEKIKGVYHTLPSGKVILVKIKSGGWRSWFIGKGMMAVTIGRVITVKEGMTLSDRGLKHELAHVNQWYRGGFFGFISFPIRYFIQHLRYGYSKNPFEQEAREYAGEPLR